MIVLLTGILATGTTATAAAQGRTPQRDTTGTQSRDTTVNLKKQQILQEVTVHGRTVIRELKESPLPVEIVDLTLLKRESGNLINILNRAPGVQLLSNGGVGDPVNVRLNGMDGKAVILFKDGIPLNFYGHAFQLGLIPPNLLSRVEIYKGALPISLGADALGGAVNFIGHYPAQREISATYEVGSFNTHRASLSLYVPDKRDRFFAGVNATYIYSDNNYRVDVGRDRLEEEENQPLPWIFDNTERHRKVHNGVSAPFVELFGGIKGAAWADELKLSAIGSRYYKDVNQLYSNYQRQLLANSIDAFADDRTYALTLAHSKKLFSNRLSLHTVLGYSHIDVKFIDTIPAHTDRFGNETGRYTSYLTYRGSHLNLDYDNYMLRFNTTYDLHRDHQLQASHILTSMNRIGTDPMGGIVTMFDNWNYEEGRWNTADVYQTPGRHNKNISALALRSHFLNRTLESLVAIKRYHRFLSGHSTWRGGESGYIGSDSNGYWGWLAGLSYRPTDRWLLKASFERAVRLPDDEEVFGDSYSIMSNFTLRPERSRNFNLQGQYNNGRRGTGEFMLAINLFYRNSSDAMFIYRDIPYSYWKNYDDQHIIAKGIELDLHYQPFGFFSLGGNGTLMERRMDEGGLLLYLYDKPPLLGNLYARVHRDDVFGKGNRAELFWYWNYRHRSAPFATSGSTERLGLFERVESENTSLVSLIPDDGRFGMDQHTVGILYYLFSQDTSVALECRNITDNILYNNWLIEMPGRSFSLTVRWAINSSKQ